MGDPQINYLNKNFSDFRSDLIKYTKTYFPQTFTDFSPASPGMMFIQMASYIGDVLSFYLDKQTRQNFITLAKQKKSIYNIAQSIGYKIKNITPSIVQLTLMYVLPQKNDLPDYDYAPVVQGITVQSKDNSNIKFTNSQIIHFGTQTNRTQTKFVRDSTNLWLVQKKIIASSVYSKTYTVTVTNTKPAYKLYLPQQNIVNIIKVTDSNNNIWYEVDNLAQNYILTKQRTSDNTYKAVIIESGKKFVKKLDENDKTYLQFGLGLPTNTATQQLTQQYFDILNKDYSSQTIKNNIFLQYNNQYSEYPLQNLTFTIQYNIGIGSQANVPSSVLTKINNINVTNRTELLQMVYGQLVLDSVAVINQNSGIGGKSAETLEQIKLNYINKLNSNQRLVVQNDYYYIANNMPSEFGTIPKLFVRDVNGVKHIYVKALDSNNLLVDVNTIIKENLKQYLSIYNLLGQQIVIKDAYTVNIGIDFNIKVYSNYNKNMVLLKCINRIKQLFSYQKLNINSAIDINDLQQQLKEIDGVRMVQNIRIYNKYGNGYSNVKYSLENALINKIVYPPYEPSIFQLKYPNTDITGTVI